MYSLDCKSNLFLLLYHSGLIVHLSLGTVHNTIRTLLSCCSSGTLPQGNSKGNWKGYTDRDFCELKPAILTPTPDSNCTRGGSLQRVMCLSGQWGCQRGPWSLRRPQSFLLCLLCLVCAYDRNRPSYTGRVVTLKSQVSVLFPALVKSSECNSQLRAQEWTHLEGCVGSTREVMACTYTNMIYLLLFIVHLFPTYFLHLKVSWWNHNSLWSGLLSPW